MVIRTVGGYAIEVSHADKVFFERCEITKLALVDYYIRVSPRMLPFLVDRPVSMHRFPEGSGGLSFFQKNEPDYFPSWIEKVVVQNKTDGTTTYVVCQNAATLAYLATQACITPHVWLSRVGFLDVPDCIIFDLDPWSHELKKIDFPMICAVALQLKKVIESAGLTAWVMTTGSRGLHVRAPIKAVHSFDRVRAYARFIAQQVVLRDPKNITLESRKEKRGTRLLIDCMRNSYGATAVPPYAVRALPCAPVAMPVSWALLDGTITSAQHYTMANVFEQGFADDPWQGIGKHVGSIDKGFVGI